MGTRPRTVVSIGLLLAAAVGGGCGRRVEPNSALGISPAFHASAAHLHQFIGEHLIQSRDLTTFEARLGEARTKFADLRTKARTESDRNVVLLLALEMTKDNQRKRIVFQTADGPASGALRHDVASLYNEREQCRTEIDGWLGTGSSNAATLHSGPCLTEARQAVAALTQFAAAR